MKTESILTSICIVLLSMGVAVAANADIDGDGVPDESDNCVNVPNGPLAGACGAQEDSDGDGYGNACDADYDQDGNTGGSDFTIFIGSLFGETSANAGDHDCDGNTLGTDYILHVKLQGSPPG